MFILVNTANLVIEFDPVQTEDKYHPSVAFDIGVIWLATSLKTKIEFKNFWIEHYELNQFQKNLQTFIEERTDLVKLCDMSLEPVMQFSRTDKNTFLEINGKAYFPPGAITLKTEIENDEVVEALERMKDWAKWW